MARATLAAFLLLSALAGAGLACQDLPQPAGGILAASDLVLVAQGSSREMLLGLRQAGGRILEYRFRSFVRDGSVQRAAFLEPGFDRGNTAIRRGETAFFRYAAWPRFDAMSARSSFLDSPLTWADALYPGLAAGYELASAAWDDRSGERLVRCELRPRERGAYRRIELWIRPGTWQTVRRVYYNPSGKAWKTAEFDGYAMAGGQAAEWRMTMTNNLTGATATLSAGPRRPEALDASFFEAAGRTGGK